MTSDPRLPSAPLGTHLTRYLHIAKHGLAGGQLSSCPRGQVEQRHGPLAPRAILIGPTDESTNYGCDLRAVLVLVPGLKVGCASARSSAREGEVERLAAVRLTVCT